ncbi:MAG: hypothetical protein LBU88_05120 [Treponema sp.]|jgi:flagellar basal body-associated protein FliL|nr:hypothetical protein [Treponema sp.]
MEKVETAKTRSLRTVYIVLLVVVVALGVFLVIGTIIGIARPLDTPLLGNTAQTQTVSVQGDDIRVFSGIGRPRIPLVNSSVLILSIAFPYQASDIAFTEELAGKISEFKNIAIDYFASLPEDQIIQINEDAAKTEILNRYNNILRLGKIPVLYFNDMMIIDAN